MTARTRSIILCQAARVAISSAGPANNVYSSFYMYRQSWMTIIAGYAACEYRGGANGGVVCQSCSRDSRGAELSRKWPMKDWARSDRVSQWDWSSRMYCCSWQLHIRTLSLPWTQPAITDQPCCNSTFNNTQPWTHFFMIISIISLIAWYHNHHQIDQSYKMVFMVISKCGFI